MGEGGGDGSLVVFPVGFMAWEGGAQFPLKGRMGGCSFFVSSMLGWCYFSP